MVSLNGKVKVLCFCCIYSSLSAVMLVCSPKQNQADNESNMELQNANNDKFTTF